MSSTWDVANSVGILNSKELQDAAEDFRYLLNRGYPRKAALELVGNRYGLTSDERHLLHRGIFSDVDSKSRHKRKIPIERIRNKDLAIDGYNVIITIEAGLSGRPLILGDDGFIRDISGLSGSFKKTEKTEEALQLILDIVKRVKPRQTLFLFDARAVKVPEKILIGFPGVIATSDTAIIDRSKEVVDLAGDIIRKRIGLKSLLRWKRKPLGG